ncbi:hypothetical protein CONLIGDRAFT_639049 [Coniochaeta ligniaria NRRL 30616]|uniref:Uncharacterized protein n=1 Tax=Coniochaeta ligniaria NRRL 30616 TaxID=1408157 RepID=A0A1J7JXA1_9PEZI|nr:hypothetical protein CONLIGDRAFT_639049 [Coniochaeta ligniaria NRRL 30616]
MAGRLPKDKDHGPETFSPTCRPLLPRSISLEKLRRAQRSLIRRRRGSKVRVSFPHQQPVAFIERQQRAVEKVPAHSRPPRADPPWIRRSYAEPHDVPRQPDVNAPPLRWVEDHRPLHQAQEPRRVHRKRTPYPLRQNDGCCDDSFDETKGHRYWGNMQQPAMSAPLNAEPCRWISGTIYQEQPASEGTPTSGTVGENRCAASPRQAAEKAANSWDARSLSQEPGPNLELETESIRRSLSQQKRLSSLAAPQNAPSTDHGPPVPKKSPPTVVSKESDHPSYSHFQPPSRTSSQKKAFKHFTKELERYADITSAPGKRANFSPTISPTPLSLNTVDELLPYRDQFLAAGLAVTSTDQRSPKGKGKEVPQFDGSPGDRDSSETSSPSSGETIIHFDDHDPVARALIEELPEPKRKRKNPREKTRSRWFHRKAQEVGRREPGLFKETIFAEQTEPPRRPPDPTSSKRPASPGASQLAETSAQREQKILEGTGQSAPVSVHVSRPTRRRRDTKQASKLPELPEDVQWRKPTQPDRFPPPVPPKTATTVQNPTVAHGHVHRPSGIRPAGSTAAAPSRNKTPSHVRNRHAPLEKPSSKQRLSTPFEQPADVPTLGNKASSTSPAMVKYTFEQPTDALMLNAGHPGHHGPPTVQDNASKSNVLKDKANGISPTPPDMVQRTSHSTPELPMTWRYAVGTPSSFEQALDAIVRKLDEMDPKQSVSEEPTTAEGTKGQPRDISPKQDSHPGQFPVAAVKKTAAKATDLMDKVALEIHSTLNKVPAKAVLSPDSKLKRAKAMRRLRRSDDAEQTPKSQVSSPRPAPPNPVSAKPGDSSKAKKKHPTETKKADTKAPSPNAADKIADHQDRDISDRDVLKGLKLAVSAACDENLDSSIREKTGLRLRRFLADLKTFEDLEHDEVEEKAGPKVDKKKGPKTGKDGAEEEEAGLGDNEADPDDDQRARRRRAERRRMDRYREFARKRKQVIEG